MTVLLVIGVGIMYVSIKYTESKFLMWVGILIGSLCMSISGYSAQAKMLNIKPFDSSYKKARKTYDDKIKSDE
ncbi:MAG: hypothetical protein JWQ10_2669 [Herbaspirillum sp.]|nr:hypothetical protein [Herbaspirillum sp.]